MAYYTGHGVTVMFGGTASDGTPLGDTWTWDGTNWTQVFPAHSPSARFEPSIAWSGGGSLGDRLVLFGGTASDGTPLGDTWTWDGTDWTQHFPTTSPAAAERRRDGVRSGFFWDHLVRW